MSVESQLTKYITEEIAIGRPKDIQPDDDLFGSGILDSLGILQLVMFIDERFSISVPDEDLVFENFSSISAITKYIEEHEPG
jgi:acyl carrier protein